MTETAAILLHLADLAGPCWAELVPVASAALRPVFLRWLIFLVAEIYPAASCPKGCGGCSKPLPTPGGPGSWVAASLPSIFYLAMMWAGGRARFARVTPHQGAVASRAWTLPRVTVVLARHGDIEDLLQDGETA